MGGSREPFYDMLFPISRDPPEGGTSLLTPKRGKCLRMGFQFLGIPPKGELKYLYGNKRLYLKFPISRDPPEGGTQ